MAVDALEQMFVPIEPGSVEYVGHTGLVLRFGRMMRFDLDRITIDGAGSAVLYADYKRCVRNDVRGGGNGHAAFCGDEEVRWNGAIRGVMISAGDKPDKQHDGAFGVVEDKVLGIRIIHG